MARTTSIPAVDLSRCMACRVCESHCPFGCIDMTNVDVDAYSKAYPVLSRENDCTGCGICAAACPVEAIGMVTPAPAAS